MVVLMVWCAVLDDPRNRPAELKVGPCFLPQVSPPQFPTHSFHHCTVSRGPFPGGPKLTPPNRLSTELKHQMFYGPYWVLAYSESEGYAIVSGGNPTIPTENGLCKTGSGVNNSGTPSLLSTEKLSAYTAHMT